MMTVPSGSGEVGMFPMMRPVAPAAIAVCAFTVKLQLPRSISAMWPVMAAEHRIRES